METVPFCELRVIELRKAVCVLRFAAYENYDLAVIICPIIEYCM